MAKSKKESEIKRLNNLIEHYRTVAMYYDEKDELISEIKSLKLQNQILKDINSKLTINLNKVAQTESEKVKSLNADLWKKCFIYTNKSIKDDEKIESQSLLIKMLREYANT